MTTEIKVKRTSDLLDRLGLEIKSIKVMQYTYQGVDCECVTAMIQFPHGIGVIDITASYDDQTQIWDASKEAYPDRGSYPDHAKIWEGRGYAGGHVSQSGWDTSQQYRRAFELLEAGYHVVDLTESGNVGGYYPSLAYWKD